MVTDKPGLTEGIEAAEENDQQYVDKAWWEIVDLAVRAAYEPIARAVREQVLDELEEGQRTKQEVLDCDD